MRLQFAFACAALALAACDASPPPLPAAPAPAAPAIPAAPEGLTPPVADLLAASPASDWRDLDPENTLYMDFPASAATRGGRVIIELAPRFSPQHVANVKALSREGYFANGADPERAPVTGVKQLNAEFFIPRASAEPFTVLPDPDSYAAEVGYVDSMPAARDADTAWLTHCYGMVGVGRENDENSGGGTELYAIIGHSPRNLDRQLTMLGRVVQGMEILAALPRGTGDIGFYATPQEHVRYADIRVAADVPETERTLLQVLRSDSETFAAVVNNRRWRKDDFYKHPVGRIGLCNAPLPVRAKPR